MKFTKIVGVLACATGLLTQGCFLAAVAPAVPKVVAALSDAAAVLNIIQNVTNGWFTHKPDAELESQVNDLLNKCWSGVRAANAATAGVDDLTQEQYMDALADFRSAYGELHRLLKREGLLNGSRLGAGSGYEAEIPEPMALSLKVR